MYSVQMVFFFFLRMVGSCVPFTFILFWVHADQKGDSKRREGSTGVWFVAHRRFCGVCFRRWTLSVCLCQTVISCCVAPSNWCKENHNRCAGNKQLPAIFFFFLTQITSYQTKAWVYREERVCHVAYPDAASSDVQSRCCLCLWVCDM